METWSSWAPTPNASESSWNNASTTEFSTTFRPLTTNRQSSDGNVVLETGLIVPLYVVIFVLSMVGNSLVLITLARKKRMRTVTNVYLLNLAVSDLLLGVFCMPFTLLGQLLRNFVFGAAMCKLIPYFQAVSVSVGVWTLVAISLERYFAICRPLKSRRWQTRFHACKMIVLVWFASCIMNSPILAVSTLQAMRYTGRHKCREEWSSLSSEKAYQLFLDVMLLLVPLLIMSVAYLLIVSKLWRGLRREIQHSSSFRRHPRAVSGGAGGVVAATSVEPSSALLVAHSNGGSAGSPVAPLGAVPLRHWASLRRPPGREGNTTQGKKAVKVWLHKTRRPASTGNGQIPGHQLGDLNHQLHQLNHISHPHHSLSPARERNRILIDGDICDGDADMEVEVDTAANDCVLNRQAIRSNYMDKSIEAKKKVIRMLFVVVAEFFVCWAPIHVLNTWYLFSPDQVYASVGSTGVSLVQLVAYVSSCCNPITYCFMNRKFRQAFLGVFSCKRCSSNFCGQSMTCDPGGPGGGVDGGEDYKGNLRRRGDPSRCPGEVDNAGDRSENSVNDSTVFAGRDTGIGRPGGFLVMSDHNGRKVLDISGGECV